MVVTLKSQLQPAGLMVALGVDEELVSWAKDNLLLKLTPTTLVLTDPKSTTDKKIGVTITQLNALKEGKLASSIKVILRKQITEALSALMKIKTIPLATPGGVLPMLPKQAVGAGGSGAPVSVEVQEPTMWEEHTDPKAQVVLLKVATRMYEPVSGTSPGSRYFVVGGNDDMRIAARYASGDLSIRVEGINLPKYATKLSLFGMKVNAGYASLHLTCQDEDLARKALGAVLIGLGVKLTSPMPDFKRVCI